MLADVVDAAADVALRALSIDAIDVVVGIEECVGEEGRRERRPGWSDCMGSHTGAPG